VVCGSGVVVALDDRHDPSRCQYWGWYRDQHGQLAEVWAVAVRTAKRRDPATFYRCISLLGADPAKAGSSTAESTFAGVA
jgi:hypothetical protein